LLSQTTEYALRAIAYLATDPERPKTTQEVAKGTRVPPGYLAKVIQLLGRAGLINARRGLHGGSMLARPASEISMLDVIQAIEPINRIETCPLGLTGHTVLCPVHKRLDDAIEAVQQMFAEVSIQGLLDENSASKPLCDVESEDGAIVELGLPKE
jgi:Rrf2 family protein